MKTKRCIGVLLILALMLTLCGCGMSGEAKAAHELIDAIGDVSLESGDAIASAEEAVAALSDKDRERLTGLDALTKAREEFDALSDADKVAGVEAMIAGIGSVDLDSRSAIDAAKAAYDGLDDRLKESVGNAGQIEAAEAAYAEACQAADAAAVEEAIAAIGEVTTDSGEAIENAKALYDALPAETQAKVDNIAALDEAEAAYEDARLEAEAAPVEEAIAALGEITTDSGEAIESAKALYEAAPAEVQAKVDNFAEIGEAETALSGLRVDEAEKQIAAIGTVDLESGEAIAAARAAFGALTPEEAAAVSNAAALTEAGEAYQTALEDHAAELLDGFTLAEEEGGSEKIYYPAGWTYYGEKPAMNQRCFIRPYIKVSDDAAQVRVVYNYTSPDKIYWTGINIYVDDETFTKSFPDGAIARDHSVGTVWEYCDDAADMDLLQAIAEAQSSVRFYFVSPAGLSNFQLSDTDAEAIRQTLEAYDAMLAAGVQPMA